MATAGPERTYPHLVEALTAEERKKQEERTRIQREAQHGAVHGYGIQFAEGVKVDTTKLGAAFTNQDEVWKALGKKGLHGPRFHLAVNAIIQTGAMTNPVWGNAYPEHVPAAEMHSDEWWELFRDRAKYLPQDPAKREGYGK